MPDIISKASTPEYRKNYDAIDWGDKTITLMNGSTIMLVGDNNEEPLRSSGRGVIMYLDEETPNDGGYDITMDNDRC